jgi:phosphatidylglycerophosphate synthase
MPGGKAAERGAETLGLRRPGPPPETRAGQPLRPFTLPNLIGYVRVVALAVFMVRLLGSENGRDTLGTVCYGIAAGGDYADGLAARLTGQYSRLGALMDPLLDRLVVICGVIVCWHFELLPRWALAALIAREAVMVVVVAGGLRMGLDISINWAGRLAVWPTMAAIAGAQLWDGWVPEALLYIGLAGSLLATALYVRDGIGQYRELRAARA